jgi:hypothetical protein
MISMVGIPCEEMQHPRLSCHDLGLKDCPGAVHFRIATTYCEQAPRKPQFSLKTKKIEKVGSMLVVLDTHLESDRDDAATQRSQPESATNTFFN